MLESCANFIESTQVVFEKIENCREATFHGLFWTILTKLPDSQARNFPEITHGGSFSDVEKLCKTLFRLHRQFLRKLKTVEKLVFMAYSGPFFAKLPDSQAWNFPNDTHAGPFPDVEKLCKF